MADDLNAFLDGTAAEEENTVAPEAAPAEVAAPEAEAPAAPEPDAEPEPEAADEAGIRKALAAERDKRRDWKEKAIRAEGEMAELRRQLEAARQPPPQPVQQEQQYQPIDPNTDPQGFVHRVQQVAISTKLDVSEMMLRKEIGSEKVDALINDFKEAAKDEPGLFAQLYSQQHPYEWAHQKIEARRLQREIGTDPNAYRAKIEAELRAKWEAERGEQPLTVPTRSPAAGLPPSLATARNAAPRGATPFNGPPPLEDVFGR